MKFTVFFPTIFSITRIVSTVAVIPVRPKICPFQKV
jgi:hypothetical protein